MNTPRLKVILLHLILILLVFNFNACKKKETDPEPPKTLEAGGFLNLNKGSTWDYITDGSANPNTITVTDSSKLAFGKDYTIFHSTIQGTTSRVFYAFKNGNYYLLVATTATDYEELVYLKDSIEVGKKWTTSVTSSGVPVIHNYEVLENGLTKTVNGMNFTDVVHVKLTIPISGYTADAYYAPNVGLIKSDEVSVGITYATELKSYIMK